MSIITVNINFAIFIIIMSFILGLTITHIIIGIISLYKDCKNNNQILPLYSVNVINPINSLEDNK